MKKLLQFCLAVSFLLFPFLNQAIAVPLVQPGYSIDLVAAGLGAVTGVAIGPTGDIFTSDYQNGRVLRINASSHSVQTYVTGLSYSTDLAFDAFGQLYVTSGSGSPRDIYRINPDGSKTLFSTGHSYTVGMEFGSDGMMYLGNSGNGTIERVDTSGNTQTFLSGYGTPGGPFGLAFDTVDNLYFARHGTGEIYKVTPAMQVTRIASLAPLGPTFVDVDAGGNVYVTDSLNAVIYSISNGVVSTFASGFTGKNNPPVIGPSGMEFSANGDLYVGDGQYLWKIAPIPEPGTMLLVTAGGLVILFFSRKRFCRNQCRLNP